MAVVLITVAGVVWTTTRSYRRGGYGPRIRMPAMTRRGRERTNRVYQQHGWAEPYDESGRLLPVSERELPNEAAEGERTVLLATLLTLNARPGGGLGILTAVVIAAIGLAAFALRRRR